MIQVAKIQFLIKIGDFSTYFPKFVLDSIRALDLYEIDKDDNIAYYFGTKHELNKLMEILNFSKVVDCEQNVTDLFYTNKLELDSIELEYLYNEFLEENVTIDNVLDRVNKYGVDNLSFFDKKMLATV